MRRRAVLWLAAWIVTLASGVWQRLSGPTYPVRARVTVGGAQATVKLLRSNSIGSGLPVTVTAPEPSVVGEVIWHRHPTDEPWISTPLVRDGRHLTATLPAQPMAGKLAYHLVLRRPSPAGGVETRVTVPAGEPAVARFKGDVPALLLLVHIVAIFAAMLYSTRAGLEALADGPRLGRHVVAATVLMLLGGVILGPFVQKAAFDAYWTGWPLGRDLTDNKVAVAMLAWLVAWLCGRGSRHDRAARGWTVAAAAITLVIFAIPHSLLGSQFDYTSVAAPPAS